MTDRLAPGFRSTVAFAAAALVLGVAYVVAEPLALRAAKIVPVSAPVINNGTIVVDGGKIVALGRTSEVQLPEGCRVLEVGRRWIMPGMVEPHIHIATNWGFNDMVQPLNPELRLYDDFDPTAPSLRLCLKAGVTTIQTVPGSGTNHAGFGVIAKTYGTRAEDMILKRIGMMKFAQAFNPERRAGDLGSGWMGMTWMLREFMTEAQAYHEACTRHEQEGAPAPRPRPALDLTRHAFRGDAVAFVHTYAAWGVLTTAQMFAVDFGLHTFATHVAFGSYHVGEEIANIPNVFINVGPRTADFYASRERQFVSHAVGFVQAGVQNVSLNTDAVTRDTADGLATKAVIAQRLGLDDPESLAAVTLNSAKAIRIDDRVGSLEVGKDADLVVKASSLLDAATPVDLVMVNGEIAYEREGWKR